MSTTIDLSTEKFSAFLEIMSILGKSCADVSIRGGIIRQINNRRNAIFIVSLYDLLGEIDLDITNVASKVDLLDPFRKQQVEMKLTIDERTYAFHDDYSRLEFLKPDEQYLTNKFMTEQELHEKLLVSDRVIFETNLMNFLVDRLSAMAKGLAASMVKIAFEDGKATFKVITNDNSNTIVGKLLTIDVEERNINGVCLFPIQPFLLVGADDDINLYCVHRQVENNILLRLTASIESVVIETWCIANLVDEQAMLAEAEQGE